MVSGYMNNTLFYMEKFPDFGLLGNLEVGIVISPINSSRCRGNESAVEQHKKPGVRSLRGSNTFKIRFEGFNLTEYQKDQEAKPGANAVQDQVVHVENADEKTKLEDFDGQRNCQPKRET